MGINLKKTINICFRRNGKANKIATKDIKVYKVINYYELEPNGFFSFYKAMGYIFGKIYKERKLAKNKERLVFGFHSYRDCFYYNLGVLAEKYAYPSLDDNFYYKGLIIECRIPKGAEYIFNGMDYISNQIVADNILIPPYLEGLDSQWKEFFHQHYELF